MISSCFYSSFIFLFNSYLAYSYKYYSYSFLFLMLFITSIIVHLCTNTYTLIIDKISIILVVLYGGFLFTKKCITCNHTYKSIYITIILSTFFLTIYLYYYGYFYNKYCYHHDELIANIYHNFLHLLVFIGHSYIVLM